jgi:hypothetical protein
MKPEGWKAHNDPHLQASRLPSLQAYFQFRVFVVILLDSLHNCIFKIQENNISKIKRRKLWPIQHLPHSIARVTRILKPLNHLPVHAPSAAKSKKSFQMNSIVRIPAPSAMNPSTFRNVNWKGKGKVFLHANRLRAN